MRRCFLTLFPLLLFFFFSACQSDDDATHEGDVTIDGDEDSDPAESTEEAEQTDDASEEEQSDADEEESRPEEKITKYIDPFIATGGDGFSIGSGFPGPKAPFGMIMPSPDTMGEFGAPHFYHCGGYYYPDPYIIGFSHTHLYGVGATDYGNILFMPTTGTIDEDAIKQSEYRSLHEKENEQASAGRYSVLLDDTGILAELTATTRTAHHRYTYPESATTDGAHVIIDLGHTVPNGRVSAASLTIDEEKNAVSGWIDNHNAFTGRYGGLRIYFYAVFDKPFTGYGTFSEGVVAAGQSSATATPPAEEDAGVMFGGYLSFSVEDAEPVQARVSISFISEAKAQLNLETESPAFAFDETATALEQTWEEELSDIRFEGGTTRQKRLMATSLFHSMFMPDIFMDVDGEYLGFDGETHTADGFTYYTDFSLWDTYRTLHSLLILLVPERQAEMNTSLLKMYEQGGGALPRWPMGNGYTNCMIGESASVVLAESYVKGIRGFDEALAFEAMKATALTPSPNGRAGRSRVEEYVDLGYVPADLSGSSTAKTMEYSINDFAIWQMAEALGETEDAARFEAHSKNYANLFHPEEQFFLGKNADGSWFTPFDPMGWEDIYTEGNAWQYLWLVPHDMAGLMALFGSKEAMFDKLNTFFLNTEDEFENSVVWGIAPPDYYWHGNEPDLHAAYMFLQVGRPDLTQYWLRWIMANLYNDTYDGWAGNDDCGTLSAWYVFNAMGFYPNAGSAQYWIGSPIFRRVEIDLPNGMLVVEAPETSEENMYVQSVTLNGEALTEPWFYHDDIKDGGVLHFEMGDTPSSWGVIE